MSHMSTLYLALEYPHVEDFDAATEAAYEPNSAFLKHLELVAQSHYAPVMLNPVRNAVMLKVAQAQMAVDALAVVIEIMDTAPRALDSKHDADELHAAHHAISTCLEVIASGGK